MTITHLILQLNVTPPAGVTLLSTPFLTLHTPEIADVGKDRPGLDVFHGRRGSALELLRDVEEEDGGVGHVRVHHGEGEEQEEEAELRRGIVLMGNAELR